MHKAKRILQNIGGCVSEYLRNDFALWKYKLLSYTILTGIYYSKSGVQKSAHPINKKI